MERSPVPVPRSSTCTFLLLLLPALTSLEACRLPMALLLVYQGGTSGGGEYRQCEERLCVDRCWNDV
jgi:hypothetical protein